MAERALATAFVNIVPGTKDFDTLLKQQLTGKMDGTGDEAGNRFNKGFGGALGKIGSIIGTALATGAVVNFTKSLIDAGEQEVAGNNRLTQIAKSMGIFGNQADAVSQRLQDLSGVQQLSLGIDDDVIKSTQAKLLTFKELAKTADETGGYFDRATQAALDLAAAGFGTAESNAVQLGKALQDPIKGITALSRSGVTFTEDEKKRIETLVKSNKMGEAQAIVLKAIETQVGGTAAATATSSDKMSQAFAQVKEDLGLILLPAFNNFANYITQTVIPNVKQFIQDFKDGKTPLNDFATALGNIIGYVKENWSWISALGVAVLSAATAFNAVKTAIELVKAVQIAYTAVVTAVTGVINLWKLATGAATMEQLGLNAAMLANPIGLVIAAIAALVAGLVWFFTQTDVGKKIWADFTKFLGDAWSGFTKWITDAWMNASKWLSDAFTNIGKFFSDTWNNIGKFLKGALDFIVYLITNWSLPGIVKNVVMLVINHWDDIVSFFKTSGEKIIGFFADAGKWLLDAGRNIIQGLIDGAGQMGNAILTWVRNLGNTIINNFKSLLGIKSPSRVFYGFGVNIGEGLANGIEYMVDPVTGSLKRLGDAVAEKMDVIVTDIGGNLLNITSMVTDFNGVVDMGLGQGKSLKDSLKMANQYTGGSLQGRLDKALGSTTFTNATTGMSVTIGAGLDPSVFAAQAQAYLDAGFKMTSDGRQAPTVIYNAAPNNSISAEQELIKAIKVARLV